MASNYAQTGWLQKDYQTQREFERIAGKGKTSVIQQGNTPTQTGSSGITTDFDLTVKKNNNIVIPKTVHILDFVDLEHKWDIVKKSNTEVSIKVKDNIQIGKVYVNNLPDTSNSYNTRDNWKREGSTINPTYGHYGWYVYGIIEPLFSLTDSNSYILNIVDLHTYDSDTPDADYVIDGLAKQQFIPEYEGITIQYLDNDIEKTKNIIIIRGIYKPTINYKYCGEYTIPIANYTDNTHTKIKTNLIYYYTLERK